MLFRSRTIYSERSPVPRILYSRNGTPQWQTAAMIPESTTAFNFAVFFSAAAVKFREQVVIVSSFGLDFRKLENSRLLNMEAYSIIWNSSIINEQAPIPQFEVFIVSILLCRETFVLKISIKDTNQFLQLDCLQNIGSRAKVRVMVSAPCKGHLLLKIVAFWQW